MQKQSILFVYVNYSSFVKADFEILSTFANVTKYQFRPGKGIIRTGIELVKEFIYLIFNGFKYDIVFVWFSDYHSMLPVLFAKILGKKSFVVIGGYDVSTLPEYSYGAFSHPIRAFFTRNTFKYVSICLPVAEALRKKLSVINPKVKAETIPTSINPEQFFFSVYERPKRVITVSATENSQRLMVKGLDRFRELAIHLPEFEFIIIGIAEGVKTFFEPLPANLILLPQVQFDHLASYYKSASVYAQLSRSEGLPNALCEAMLCECIPIGTNVGGIPTAIGDAGYLVEYNNDIQIAEAIRRALVSSPESGEKARDRIASHFNIRQREEALKEVVAELLP